MDIEDNSILELQKQLQGLSFKDEEIRRRANSIVATTMPWEEKPNSIDQYNQIYLDRLEKLCKRIALPKMRKIQELDDKLGTTVSIVGIFKRIETKRKRAFENQYDQYYANLAKIYDDNDELELEDASGRVKFVLAPGATLRGKPLKPTDLPYGIIIGLTGFYHDSKHCFVVSNITLPKLPPQQDLLDKPSALNRKMIILSEPSPQYLMYVLSQITEYQHDDLRKQIQSVVVMGFQEKLSPEQVKMLDLGLKECADLIDIFIMPGMDTRESYPQKPIHPILFSHCYQGINLVNNPQIFRTNTRDDHQIDVDHLGARMLFFSGENLKDLIKNCSEGDSSLDSLQSLVEFSHMAPTSPFSLKSWMMPEDYLVIQELPHLVVSGKCEATLCRDFVSEGKKVRLATVKTGGMILVDIDSLETREFSLGSPSSDFD